MKFNKLYLLLEIYDDIDVIKKPWNGENIWWHSSVSGDLSKSWRGIHLGTYEAATEALEATIGVPLEGTWDGTREYGKTLLCGYNSLKNKNKHETGYNVHLPENDFYAPDREEKNQAKFGNNGGIIPFIFKPIIESYKIIGSMYNTPRTPISDDKANMLISRQINRGAIKNGYYYVNKAEDYGSISAVVPNSTFIIKL